MAMPMIDDHSFDHVFYPDSDDEPMAENMLQAEIIRTLILGFQRRYAGRPDVLVAGDAFWYPVRGEPKVVLAPDTLVVVDLPAPPDFRVMGSYRQFEFGGHVALVVEVLSPSNTWAEMVRKRQFYDRHGADEYWAFDPDHGALEVWVRQGDALVELPVPEEGIVSPATGVTVRLIDGMLAVFDAGSDRRWLFPLDEAMRAEAERERAEAERERADAERERADAAAARVAQLEARLAALGAAGEPPATV